MWARYYVNIPHQIKLPEKAEIITIDFSFTRKKKSVLDSFCVFIDKQLEIGVFNIIFSSLGASSGLFGMAQGVSVSDFTEMETIPGSCGIYSFGIACGDDIVVREQFFSLSGTEWLSVMLEYDAGDHTLHFFVAEKQMLHAVTEIPRSPNFFFGLSELLRVKVKSFKRLALPTVYVGLSCAEHKWR